MIQQEGGRLQDKEKDQCCRHLDLRLPASRTVRGRISVPEATWRVAVFYGSLRGLMHWINRQTSVYTHIFMVALCSHSGTQAPSSL